MNLNFLFSKKIKKMKRHDTHLLSDESEKNDKDEEDAHQYSFSNSSSESYNSKNNYISKEARKKSPIKLNLENNNDTIISSHELEDIFQGKIEGEKNKKKKKPKKHKYYVKLKKVKLNKEKEGELVESCLTFTPSPRYDIILDNAKQNNNFNLKNEKKFNFPVLNTDKNIQKNEEKKEENNKKEKEVLYFFYNDDQEGNKNLKKIINIINKQKMKLFQVSDKNCFTIKTTKNFNISTKPSQIVKYKNNKGYMENYKSNGIERYNKIRREKINYSAKSSFLVKKSQNFLQKENNKNSYLNLSLQNHNKTNYHQSISNNNNSNNNNFKSNKEKLLYDLYCGKNDFISNNNNNLNAINKKQRIKSTDSLINHRQIQRVNKNMNNMLEREDYYPEYIRYMEIHNREKENRKIIKNMFRRAGHNFSDFNRHVGNDMNCPICQAMQMKNDNNIKIKGIRPLVSSISNNSTQNSWQNRRMYSALSRILTKRRIEKSGARSTNISHTININKSKYNMSQKNNNLSNISKISNNKLKNKNNKAENPPFRKLHFNRSDINPNKFPNSNKALNFKNKVIKYN